LRWINGIVLMAAVAMVQRAQAAVETSPIEGDFVR